MMDFVAIVLGYIVMVAGGIAVVTAVCWATIECAWRYWIRSGTYFMEYFACRREFQEWLKNKRGG